MLIKYLLLIGILICSFNIVFIKSDQCLQVFSKPIKCSPINHECGENDEYGEMLLCNANHYCSNSTSSSGRYPVCKKLPGRDEKCDHRIGCQYGYMCASSGHCKDFGYGQVGQECRDDNQCLDGLFCIWNGTQQQICGAPSSSCVNDVQCPFGQYCSSKEQVCLDRLVDYQECDSNEESSPKCQPFSHCMPSDSWTRQDISTYQCIPMYSID
ncbi:hypothetical protein DFA_04501 [Cavenderia fasciculata]|uniref:Dickkopf N-terminal cysteine-rich domain-containing protein n=1 Tax=Cavenderia fasciculata TaxID=261658 RepID=F4PPS0_CACFS|nr:uncharacterized protein DFA_04501 [Cavenderia fasciculata]EGG22383.1 hypothetical protein DFA_04501 [Cavenderia fasciculata]|eukprot:XP_004360234.1 hypothetical protein DFA_04501 [Cavenderia fasciculata]